MKVLVVGCNGQLGQTLRDTCPPEVRLSGRDMPDVDISNSALLHALVSDEKPGTIVNVAAYTAVDRAESEQALAERVNVHGARIVAEAAVKHGARIIHVSTDFVFDGRATAPYQTSAPTAPLSVYGRTKRDGELAVLREAADRGMVIRTAWLYSKYGSNFVKTMLKRMRTQSELRVVDDQRGSPTWCGGLAKAIWAATVRPVSAGVYHWTDDGVTSWYEFAVAIHGIARELDLLNRDVRISPIKTSDYPTPARRPSYSALDCESTRQALGLDADHWTLSLRRMLEGMTQ